MKKNILIVALAILLLFTMFYAFIKADEATKAAEQARLAQTEAESQKVRADEQARLALDKAAEATAAQAEAERLSNELSKCQSK